MSDMAVDPQHPWPGLASFTEDARAYFYGREDEVAELARRVQRKLLTILFGQSGLGKTSILAAGIAPRLRAEGFCPVYVRIDHAPQAPVPSEQIKQAILRASASAGRWTKPGAAVEGESLWEFLHHRDDLLLDDAGRALTLLLVFDQFEEIFTLAQADAAGHQRAAGFIEDLADLVENRLPKVVEAKLDGDESVIEHFDLTRGDYRVLIALREDYLAHLEGLKAQMPSITQNRMRLARMTGAQALDAVRKPGGALVNEEVAEAIVRFIAGGAELRNAEVEPSLLSLICRELNNTRIAQSRPEISADLLAGSRETILAEFYERALADQLPSVRRFIEDEMLTESGFRESLTEERVLKAFAATGAAPDARATLATLVNRRLLRIEERLDLRRAELTHDVLCGVVSSSRDMRHEREARDQAERQLAEQRARETATHQALVRARQIAAGCALLAVVAISAAGFGVWGMQRAQATKAMAEAARGESERLMVYLLDDFQRELEPVGRLQLVGELAQRAIDYYQALPAELRSPETERNQALAQVRRGAVLGTQGKLDEARKLLGAAIPALDALREKGDASEAAVIGLSAGLVAQSGVFATGGGGDDALPPAERALAVLAPAAQASDASVAMRRSRAAALAQVGFLQTRRQQHLAAVASLEAARAAYRGIDELRADSDASAGFGRASAWLVEAFGRLDRPADAERAGAEGLGVTTQLLEREPTNMLALRARGLIWSAQAVVAQGQLQPAHRLVAAEGSARDLALLVRIDPGNAVTRRNLIRAREQVMVALWDLGRLREALARNLELREFETFAATSPSDAGALSNSLYWASILAAELGQAATAERFMADALRHLEVVLRGSPQASLEAAFWRSAAVVAPLELANLQGNPARARAAAEGERERLLQLQPADDISHERVAGALRRLHLALGWAELQAGDHSAAQGHFSHVAEARKRLPARTLWQRNSEVGDAALLAITLARAARLDEARALAEPALAWQREQQGRLTEYPWRHANLALALVAAAESTPAKAGALLVEAQAALDRLPAEARASRSGQRVQGLIADARRMGR